MAHIFRREWLKSVAIGFGGLSLCNWLPAFADQVVGDPKRRRHLVVLWMSGGPSQTDTFDMKPNHENGGSFKEIATNVPGVRFCEHLPLLAKQADQLAIIRSLQTKEGDHSRGTYYMRTGQKPMGTITYPSISCSLAKALGNDSDDLPHCVSIAPFQAFDRQAFGPGFLGPKYTPMIVDGNGGRTPATVAAAIASAATGNAAQQGFAELKINALQSSPEVTVEQLARRRDLLSMLQKEFVEKRTGSAARAHDTVYERSINMMTDKTAEAFDLSKEPEKLREAYGRGVFGQGCLMARRLIERNVPVIEVGLGGGSGWDTHSNIFEALKPMLAELDAGWSTLMSDLKDRGLLESTTILWMGEFGRTPKINAQGGRDHFPAAWSCVLAGGGVKGGQTYGQTSKDGQKVEENPVDSPDVLTTLAKAVGVNPATENLSNIGRPIKIIEGNAIKELLS